MLEIVQMYKRVQMRLYMASVVQFCGYSLPPMFHYIQKYTSFGVLLQNIQQLWLQLIVAIV